MRNWSALAAGLIAAVRAVRQKAASEPDGREYLPILDAFVVAVDADLAKTAADAPATGAGTKG